MMHCGCLTGEIASDGQNNCPPLQKMFKQGAQCRGKSLSAECVAKGPMEQHFEIKTVNIFLFFTVINILIQCQKVQILFSGEVRKCDPDLLYVIASLLQG